MTRLQQTMSGAQAWQTLGLMLCLQARAAHSRHNVLPVPVGLSNSAFLPCDHQTQHIADLRVLHTYHELMHMQARHTSWRD